VEKRRDNFGIFRGKFVMCKKFLVTLGILMALIVGGGFINPFTDNLWAHGHGRHGCCGYCDHYVCPGDCRRCEECLAKQRALKEAVVRCEKCGHEECSGNCKRCVDCLTERIERLEREREGKK
jgi:hypothetical protein